MAKTVITHVDKQGKPKTDSNVKSADKYSTYNVKLPKGQDGANLYVISDVYINSRESKVHLKKLTEDVERIKNDPNALLVVNGNMFWFDDAVFGFQKGQFVPDAFKIHVDNSDKVKQELKDLKLLAVKPSEREKLKQKMSDDDKKELQEKLDLEEELFIKGYQDASDDAKVGYIMSQLKSDPNFQKTAFYKENKEEIKFLLQKKAYEPFVKDYVKLFSDPKVKDKIVVINPGNEEEKVLNFRQYNPLFDVANQLGKLEVYSDTRFWQLNLTYNSYLTDNQNKTAMFMGAYGIFNANTLQGLQGKIRTIFKGFTAFDGYLVSGYETNGYTKGEAFFNDQYGNVVIKPEVTFFFAGYRKIRETNNVRLQSYIVERDLNRQAVNLTYSRNPAYIAENIVDKQGNIIDFSHEYFMNLHKLTLKETEKPFMETFAVRAPYRLYSNVESMYAKSQILQDARTVNSRSKTITGLAIIDMIRAKQQNAQTYLEEQMNTQESNFDPQDGQDYVKSFNKYVSAKK